MPYSIPAEPDKRDRALAWNTAIGLQDVDRLKPSEYLHQTAQDHIEGYLTISEAKQRIDSYYQSRQNRSIAENRTEEADKVSTRIAEILSSQAFNFSPVELLATHRRLFSGIYPHAGKVRDYNISKREWVLGGKSVIYTNADSIIETLNFDFTQEKQFRYKGLTTNETIAHISHFVADLWQIHPFGEGNTRTTAVFTIQYLRSMGFDICNAPFASHSWYFRNALVRANYNDYPQGIFATTHFVELFFRNLLLGEQNELKNRHLLISNDNDRDT